MAGAGFSYFVIFAEMRTGSNFLEANINQFADLKSFGELFNPHFIGGEKRAEMFGIGLRERERDPGSLLAAVRSAGNGAIPGFRYFHDHDPRILDMCLNDPECGKVVLTRNPLDSYVSRKIAAATGQWKLTNLKHQKTTAIAFDAAEFEKHLESTQSFQLRILNTLQKSGQAAFYIHYDDLSSVEILNGLAGFLGSGQRCDTVSRDTKKQNPGSLRRKVSNFPAMVSALGDIDFMTLSRSPNFEPRRGAAVPGYVAGTSTPLLFAPVRGGPESRVLGWMAAQDGVSSDQLTTGFNQKTLRQWRRANPGFQSFSVLRHPLARAHGVFCRYIAKSEIPAYADLRIALIKNFGVAVPKKGAPADGYDLSAHRNAFSAFLTFLGANLTDQTSHRIDPAWASQTAVIQGISSVMPVAHLIRESDLVQSLRHVEVLAGLDAGEIPSATETAALFSLADVHDTEIEEIAKRVYARDYLNFGFGDWRPDD